MKTIIEVADTDNQYIKQLKIKQAQTYAKEVSSEYYIIPKSVATSNCTTQRSQYRNERAHKRYFDECKLLSNRRL